jgi:hypothetical protein
MNQGKAIKKILQSKLEGSRKKGRPRLRCLEGEEKDVWEMKVKDGDRRRSMWKNERL